MAQIPALRDHRGAGETRKSRESLLQNTKGWARPFASSPAFFFACRIHHPALKPKNITEGKS
jgi:hypothetical protein